MEKQIGNFELTSYWLWN